MVPPEISNEDSSLWVARPVEGHKSELDVASGTGFWRLTMRFRSPNQGKLKWIFSAYWVCIHGIIADVQDAWRQEMRTIHGMDANVRCVEKQEMRTIHGMDASVRYVEKQETRIIHGMDASVRCVENQETKCINGKRMIVVFVSSVVLWDPRIIRGTVVSARSVGR
jgi:hypothetical protein